MKRIPNTLITLLTATVLLTGCNSNEKDDPSSTREITFHNVEYSGNETQSNEEELKAGINDFINHYDYSTIKLDITSDGLLYDKDNKKSGLYGLDHLSILAKVNNVDPYYGYFLARYPLNFNPGLLNSAEASMYDPLLAFNLFNYEIRTISSYLRGDTSSSEDYDSLGVSYFDHKIVTNNMTIKYGEHYFISSASYQFKNQNYYYSFNYYNASDIPNTKKEVKEELFKLSLFAKANHEIDKKKVHFTADGNEYIQFIGETGSLKEETRHIHYESFVLYDNIKFDLLKSVNYAFIVTSTNYQEPILPDLDETGLEFFLQRMQIYNSPGTDFLFNTFMCISFCDTHIGWNDQYGSVVKSQYYINEFQSMIRYKKNTISMYFTDDGYIKKVTFSDSGATSKPNRTYTWEYSK